MAGHASRLAERDLSVTQAWLTVALALGKKDLPPLDRLLSGGGGSGKQTPAQQKALMQQMAARFGIELEQTQLIRKH